MKDAFPKARGTYSVAELKEVPSRRGRALEKASRNGDQLLPLFELGLRLEGERRGLDKETLDGARETFRNESTNWTWGYRYLGLRVSLDLLIRASKTNLSSHTRSVFLHEHTFEGLRDEVPELYDPVREQENRAKYAERAAPLRRVYWFLVHEDPDKAGIFLSWSHDARKRFLKLTLNSPQQEEAFWKQLKANGSVEDLLKVRVSDKERWDLAKGWESCAKRVSAASKLVSLARGVVRQRCNRRGGSRKGARLEFREPRRSSRWYFTRKGKIAPEFLHRVDPVTGVPVWEGAAKAVSRYRASQKVARDKFYGKAEATLVPGKPDGRLSKQKKQQKNS